MDYKRSKAKTESLEESRRVIVDSNGRHFFADSFDRFGDDMCEELLSFLTLRDVIAFQEVSKQWNRCLQPVLRRQTSLVIILNIDHDERERKLNNMRQFLKYYPQNYNYVIECN